MVSRGCPELVWLNEPQVLKASRVTGGRRGRKVAEALEEAPNGPSGRWPLVARHFAEGRRESGGFAGSDDYLPASLGVNEKTARCRKPKGNQLESP